jgi:glucose-1-phosphate cytidylyltransferase
MTGARIARAAARYLGEEAHFGVTYGDGLTDADLGASSTFTRGTRSSARPWRCIPPSQFGCFDVDVDGDGDVRGFAEKPRSSGDWINGGFFFFRRTLSRLSRRATSCVLEREPLQRLAREGGLELFRHQGFWSCIDTVSDHKRLCEDGTTPWSAAGDAAD